MSGLDPDANGIEQSATEDSRVAARLSALECLANSAGSFPSHSNARRVLIELGTRQGLAAGGVVDEFELLMNAAEQLGVRTSMASLSLSQAVDLAGRRIGLATFVAGNWWAVTGASSNRLRIETVQAGSRWISLEAMAQQLELPSVKEPVRWLLAEGSSLPTSGVSHGTSDEHGHGPSPLRRLIGLLRPEARDIGVVALFSAVVGVLSLATPLAVEALVNTVAIGRLIQPLMVLCLILAVFLGFGAALKALQAYLAELIQQRLFVRVVADLAYRLPRVDRRAFDDKHAPELLNRFFDVMTVQKSAALLVLDGLAIVLKTLIGMTVLAFYHPLFIGFDLFLLAILASLIFVLGRGAVRTAIEESRSKYAVAAWLQELAQFSETFKGDGGPRHAFERADELTGEYVAARRAHFRVLMRQVIFALGMHALTGSLLLAIGGWLVMQGQITLGQLVAAELIVAVIVDTFAKLNKHAESLYDLLAAVNKIGILLDLPFERLKGDVLATSAVGVAVRLDRAGFSFEDGVEVFRDLDLQINAGEMLAVAGPPRAETSLLLDLLFGLRQVTQGYITADDADLRSLSPASYRGQVALARTVAMFTGTLAENVHLNRDCVDGRQVREALQAVGLWDDVLQLPQGVATPLQPSGGPLSDSQARRLMLARAIAICPRLLLIDGLLDALPDAVLPAVIECLKRLQPRCTIVIVTGRDEIRSAFPTCNLDGPREDREWQERTDESTSKRVRVI